jgi:DNA topoisomerase-1
MAEARLKYTTVSIRVEDALFRASGRTVIFPGFFRAYLEGSDDPEAALEDQDTTLPELKVDEVVDVRDLEAIGHETKPPARYTEASLVKALEAEGIGRPSTYATIIDTIQERGYCFKQRKELVPTFVAFAVTQLLEDHFEKLVDLNFTAEMEQTLDDIAEGDTGWLEYLRRFYLGQQGLETQVKEKEAQVDPRNASQVSLSDLQAEIRIGQFGPFLARGENGDRVTVSLPDSLPPADLDPEMVERLLSQKGEGPEVIGEDPESGKPIYLKVGPYGPYVQLGDEAEPESGKGRAKKPKRSSLLKGMSPADVDLDLALKLLSLPRSLGAHPETGEDVKAGVGRFGPFVVHQNKFVSIKAPDHVLEIDLERAVDLLASKPDKGATSKKVLKDLGVHPEDDSPIQILEGRYGPYINHKRTNASLPKDLAPESVTLEQALKMLAEKTPKKKSSRKRKS